MQRKNNFLKLRQHRSGMAMIMALTTIVILATIMALSLSFTAESTKRTTDVYLYEQAVLVSKSAAELALLNIAQTGPCTPGRNYIMDLDSNGAIGNDIYDVNVTLRYVYDGPPIGCNNYTNVTTDEQNGSVLTDITVTTNAGTEPIRYFRRIMQKL